LRRIGAGSAILFDGSEQGALPGKATMSPKHILIAALAATVVTLLAALTAAQKGGISFNETELAALKAGETVRQELSSSRKGGFYGGTGWALVEAPADEIWQVLVDWETYPSVFSYTEEMTELSRKGPRSLIRMRLGHPIISVLYHLEMRQNKERKTLKFKMVKNHPHDLDEIRGYWRLFPQSGDRTLVAYVVAFKVPMGIVNLVGEDFENEAMSGILGAPGFLKHWVETGTQLAP
jgi:ribosome-associated toxin RatA of RatAB toxin-antitoxin module